MSEEICFVGFVMDEYCIDRDIMFDSDDERALIEPDQHSFHCLLDIDRCVHTGYQLLMDEPNSNGRHCRAFVLDDQGNDLVAQEGRRTGERGFCTTCTGAEGSPTRGFRATVYGTLPNPNGSAPLLLQVSRVEAASAGCPDGAFVPTKVNCESGEYLPFFAAHGSLMLLSWGFLLPLGVLSARLLRHRTENALWFKIHRVAQPIGLVLAIAGFIVAIAGPFDILGSGVYDKSFAHAVTGTIVMGLGISQPLNAYLRPHKPEDPQEASSFGRKCWEISHKSIGYLAVIAGLANCFIGQSLVGKYEKQFMGALIASLVILGLFVVWACFDKRRCKNKDVQSESDDVAAEDDEEDNVKNTSEEEEPLKPDSE